MEESKRPPNFIQRPTTPINQESLPRHSHEIRIPMHIRTLVHPRHHLLQELANLLHRPLRLELCNLNRPALHYLSRRIDMRFEGLDVCNAVPIHCARQPLELEKGGNDDNLPVNLQNQHYTHHTRAETTLTTPTPQYLSPAHS